MAVTEQYHPINVDLRSGMGGAFGLRKAPDGMYEVYFYSDPSEVYAFSTRYENAGGVHLLVNGFMQVRRG